MKRLYSTVLCACVLLVIGACVPAYAGDPGTSCADAIPLTKDYSVWVQSGKTIWYKAWTFDLPLTVTFAPEHGEQDKDHAPEVSLDFTCTPGYYENEILCSLFCPTSSGPTFDMPHSPSLGTQTLDDGTFVFYISLGKKYRDMMLKMGISDNVEAYVKVTYKCNGTISLAPDELFNNCVDNAKFMHYGDTVQVKTKDKKRHVVVPYVQWQEDTIYYKWTGTTPCYFAMSNTCDFDPDPDAADDKRMDAGIIQPGDSLRVGADLIYKYVHNQEEYPNEAGMYFAKFYSEEPGKIQIVKAAQAPPRGKATIMRLDRTYALNANETSLFALTKSWDNEKINSKFTTPTSHVFRMSISTDPDFSEEHMLKSYQFEKNANGHMQGIFGKDMVQFWKNTKEQYLYVRFECSEATTVTPSEWEVSACVKDTKNFLYTQDTTFNIQRNSNGGNYRLIYSQWKSGDMKVTFTSSSGSSTCKMFVAKDCDITTSTTAGNLLKYKQLTAGQPITISQEDVDGWATNVDQDGYIYVRFHHTVSGTNKIRLQSSAPEEQDPTYPSATIAMLCEEGSKIIVSVSEDQSIVITDENDNEVDAWDAVVDETHELNLTPGKYILQGKGEKIDINL